MPWRGWELANVFQELESFLDDINEPQGEQARQDAEVEQHCEDVWGAILSRGNVNGLLTMGFHQPCNGSVPPKQTLTVDKKYLCYLWEGLVCCEVQWNSDVRRLKNPEKISFFRNCKFYAFVFYLITQSLVSKSKYDIIKSILEQYFIDACFTAVSTIHLIKFTFSK